MINVFEGAGIFLYPLVACSFAAVVVIVERLIALRSARVMPKALIDGFVDGKVLSMNEGASVGGRIVMFFKNNGPDIEALKAYAALETTRLERGMFILDIVVGASPLIGLLGTVTGLIQVFAGMDPNSGLPDPRSFIEGIALALTTTMLGLSVAIPAFIGSSYLSRRIDVLSAQIAVGVERLIDIAEREDADEAN